MSIARGPIYGLFTYIGVFYLHPPSRWWGEALPDLRWVFLAAGVTLISMIIHSKDAPKQRPWIRTTPGLIMVLFTLWYWVIYFWALVPDRHIDGGVLITKYILVFWMIYHIINTQEKVTAFLFAHFFGCVYLGLLAWGFEGGGRLNGVGGPGINDANTLGMQFSTGVIAGAMLMFLYRIKIWFALAPAIAMSLNGLILTGTRGGFLALICGGGMLYLLKPHKRTGLFYLGAILALGLLGYVASETFWDRIQTIAPTETEVRDTSAHARLALFSAQWEMSQAHPLGTGHRGTEALSHDYLDPIYMSRDGGARSSHNVILTVLVEQGWPGLILMGALALWCGLTLVRLKRHARHTDDFTLGVHVAAIGGVLGVVFAGGIFADFSKCEVQIWFFALLAALREQTRAVPAESRRESREPYAAQQLNPA